MEPRIQYAKTSDGVSIAYAQAGEGPDIVCVPLPGLSHAQLVWEQKQAAASRLLPAFRVTTYDSRGCGLSQRDDLDFSLDAMLLDLEAAVEAAGPERFVLYANIDGVPVAVKYAAYHPDRVSHLILVDGWVQYSDFMQTGAIEMEKALREMDWALFTETFGRVLAGFDDTEDGIAFAEYMRACVTQEAWGASQEALTQWDVRGELSRITVPTPGHAHHGEQLVASGVCQASRRRHSGRAIQDALITRSGGSGACGR